MYGQAYKTVYKLDVSSVSKTTPSDSVNFPNLNQANTNFETQINKK